MSEGARRCPKHGEEFSLDAGEVCSGCRRARPHPSDFKHGPNEMGGTGPCEPDCTKCALEYRDNEMPAVATRRYNLAIKDDVKALVDTLTDDHAALVAYLLSAVRRKDWHAVSDAANDLRVMEAKR